MDENSSRSRSTRLMKEWLEIKTCPVPNASVSPLNEENLNEWHGNIQGVEGSEWSGIVVHFIITFPVGYPTFPPRVKLCSFVPHLNIQNRQGSWQLCLDMLESEPLNSTFTIPYQYWSSAFSIRSVLIQMTSFLLVDDHPVQSSAGNIHRTRSEIDQFVCSHCGHSASQLIPPLPSEEDLATSPLSFPCVAVSGDLKHSLQSRIQQRKLVLREDYFAKIENQDLKKEEDEMTSISSSSTKSDPQPPKEKNEWVTVKRRSSPKSSEDLVPQTVLIDSFAQGMLSCSQCLRKLPDALYSRSQLKKGPDRKCSKCLDPNQSIRLIDQPCVLTKKQYQTKSRPRDQSKIKKSNFLGFGQQSYYDLTDSESVNNSVDSLEYPALSDLNPLVAFVTHQHMGLFQNLGRDTSVHLLSFLSCSDILSFGMTSRGLCSMCDDWLVWKFLFQCRYPRSALRPSGPNSSWKRAYMLEANSLSQDLTCFHSLMTRKEGVLLGFPIWYTTNPKTGLLDYATSTFDILSFDSFSKDKVRKTVWGEKFTNFLPVYIDEGHFSEALPIILSVSKQVTQVGLLESPRQTPDSTNQHKRKIHQKYNPWHPQNEPEMVLTLLSKMMNTQVVLLCDKGVSASETALSGYCQLHRLLLAVVQEFPALRNLIRKRLDDFIRKPETRVKAKTPSLGELLTFLSVSDTYSWQQLSMAYLKECFDRSVLWSCTKDASLATVVPGDMTRLDKYLETQKVSLRLTLFHAVFLDLLVDGGGSKPKLALCLDRYDTFQGRPPLYIRRKWQIAVKEILTFNTWPQFFSISRIPLPTKPQLLLALEQSVVNSLEKGYHSKSTVFENVMKSGVSQILLKGETYTASPNLKRIQMLEKWRFDGHSIFLDASCLIYNFAGKHVGTVDYDHQSWIAPSDEIKVTRFGRYSYVSTALIPCVRHSGDVIDHQEGTGQHTIDIDIQRIPQSVGALYFTVSSWTTTLKDISQPSAHLFDPENNSELCRYKLEDTDTKSKTAVIMCKLFRKNPSSRWELLTIGHVGFGRADHYESILQDIQRLSSNSQKSVQKKK